MRHSTLPRQTRAVQRVQLPDKGVASSPTSHLDLARPKHDRSRLSTAAASEHDRRLQLWDPNERCGPARPGARGTPTTSRGRSTRSSRSSGSGMIWSRAHSPRRSPASRPEAALALQARCCWLQLAADTAANACDRLALPREVFNPPLATRSRPLCCLGSNVTVRPRVTHPAARSLRSPSRVIGSYPLGPLQQFRLELFRPSSDARTQGPIAFDGGGSGRARHPPDPAGTRERRRARNLRDAAHRRDQRHLLRCRARRRLSRGHLTTSGRERPKPRLYGLAALRVYLATAGAIAGSPRRCSPTERAVFHWRYCWRGRPSICRRRD